MDRLSKPQINPCTINAQVFIIVQIILWQGCDCEITNFNDYIDMFPSSYFVNLYFDKISTENLVSPSVPYTLFRYNKSESSFNKKSSCKSYAVRRSFNGSGTVTNTLNLVSVDWKDCYTKSEIKVHHGGQCRVLESVGGGLCLDEGGGCRCSVNGNQMITLLIVKTWEKEGISQNALEFWWRLRSEYFPNYVLILKSTTVRSIILCQITMFIKPVNASFVCGEEMEMSETSLYRIEQFLSRTIWSTGLELLYSRNDKTVDTSENFAELMYLEGRVEEVFTTECLNRANETGTVRKTSYDSKSFEKLSRWAKSGCAEQYFLVDTTRTSFLSCYSEPKVQFVMYLQPFHELVWITILFCCSSFALLISVYNRKLKLSNSFNPFLFFISTLVEEPYSVPSVIWNDGIFRSITCTWILTATIFSNLYAGIMISDVTAPLPGKILESFDHVLNTQTEFMKLSGFGYREILHFWLWNYTATIGINSLNTFKNSCGLEAEFDSKHYNRHHAQFRDGNSFALLQAPVASCLGKKISNEQQTKYISHPWIYSGVRYVKDELKNYRHGDDKAYSKRLVAFFSPRNRHYPEDPEFTVEQSRAIPHYLSSAIEKEVVACKKSIFVGDTKDLIEENAYLKLNYPTKSFYISDDTFETEGSKPVIWKFVNGGKSKVPYYFQQLMESGISQGIAGLRKHQYYLKRRIGTNYIHDSISKVENVGISGSIQTIFFILIGSLSVAFVAFNVEFVFGNRPFGFLSQMYSQWTRSLKYGIQLKGLIKLFFDKFIFLSAMAFKSTLLSLSGMVRRR
jgi:hypothetical protein